MKFKLFFISILLTSFFINAQTKDSNTKLKRVVEDFRTSIIEHNDAKKFYNLFLHDSITWSAIFTNKTKQKVLEQMPNLKFHSTSYKTFYKNLKDNSEEKFYNVEITRRSEFATISFDYTFSINSNSQNWGTEYWSLILIDDMWKITSVARTMNKEEIEKCPFSNKIPFTIN